MTEHSTVVGDGVAVTETLDCSGLLCPLPVYKASMVLNRLEPGEVLKLITTDPGALEDIPALARQRGDEVVQTGQTDDRQEFLVRKGGAA